MHSFRQFVLSITAFVGVMFAAPAACAHDLFADVESHADGLRVLAYDEDNLPADSATVTILDAGGNVIATGRTDERGVWVFPRPAPGMYKLHVKWTGHVREREFHVPGEPDGVPSAAAPQRRNKVLGLSIGLVLLLGISAASWLIRRRRTSR